MEAIIQYFETISSLHRSLILAGGITFFWLIESAVPLFRFSYRKWRHAWPNFFFTLTSILINFILAFILLMASDWTVVQQFGLIQWLNLPLWASVALGILFLDLIGAYFAHWFQHKNKLLWLFHVIHHSDVHIDTTSANRHHPGESLVRFVFTTLAVLLIGTPIAIIMMYQSISVVISQFNHANIRLPQKIDHLLNLVIVSPNMHKIHHHFKLPQTDTNYGNIFSFWDRIFKTYHKMPIEEVIYGLDTYPELNDDSTIVKLLTIPFEGYRTPPNL